jgi:hypothetical protein
MRNKRWFGRVEDGFYKISLSVSCLDSIRSEFIFSSMSGIFICVFEHHRMKLKNQSFRKFHISIHIKYKFKQINISTHFLFISGFELCYSEFFIQFIDFFIRKFVTFDTVG